MHFQVPGDPHLWPRDAGMASSACAVIVVDMQEDYCSPGYYLDRAGYDTGRLREPVERIQRVLSAARRSGLHVIYTRHGRAPDSSRSEKIGDERVVTPAPGPRTAAQGEPGWQIVPELLPDAHDAVIEKSTCSAFVSGELDRILRSKGVRHLAFCGNTIDVCVHSTLRAAVDLDYECLLLGDCCGAVNDGLHTWAIASVKIEDGVFGTVATAEAFISAFLDGTD
jgi:nicotinamidase-related amidase